LSNVRELCGMMCGFNERLRGCLGDTSPCVVNA
jgi:hypothetical protein